MLWCHNASAAKDTDISAVHSPGKDRTVSVTKDLNAVKKDVVNVFVPRDTWHAIKTRHSRSRRPCLDSALPLFMRNYDCTAAEHRRRYASDCKNCKDDNKEDHSSSTADTGFIEGLEVGYEHSLGKGLSIFRHVHHPDVGEHTREGKTILTSKPPTSRVTQQAIEYTHSPVHPVLEQKVELVDELTSNQDTSTVPPRPSQSKIPKGSTGRRHMSANGNSGRDIAQYTQVAAEFDLTTNEEERVNGSAASSSAGFLLLRRLLGLDVLSFGVLLGTTLLDAFLQLCTLLGACQGETAMWGNEAF